MLILCQFLVSTEIKESHHFFLSFMEVIHFIIGGGILRGRGRLRRVWGRERRKLIEWNFCHMGFNLNQSWFWSCYHQHLLHFLMLSFCLHVLLKTETVPKLKQVSLFSHAHLFLELWGVFLNTDNFLLHHAEPGGWEICLMLLEEMLGRGPGHIPRPDCPRCSCLCNIWGRTSSISVLADNISEGTDEMLIMLQHNSQQTFCGMIESGSFTFT